MKLHLSTPQKTFPAVEVNELTLSTEKGEVVVLPGHARMLCRIVPGKLSYRNQSESKSFQIGVGPLEIFEGELSVLTDEVTEVVH